MFLFILFFLYKDFSDDNEVYLSNLQMTQSFNEGIYTQRDIYNAFSISPQIQNIYDLQCSFRSATSSLSL